MSKVITFGLMLILLLLLLTACVPQADYIKVSSDLSVAQMQIQSLQSEATISKTQIESLQNELATAKTQNQSIQSQLTAKDSDLIAARSQVQSLQKERDSINAKLAQGKARIEILNDIMIPSITGELNTMSEAEQWDYFFKWRDKVVVIGDPMLTAKFQMIMDTLSDQASSDFFKYLLESIPKVLGG